MAPEEIARLGDEIYERQVRTKVESGNQGKIVAIDVLTGAFAVGDTALQAAERLSSEHPDAEVWLARIGERALHRMSARPRMAALK